MYHQWEVLPQLPQSYWTLTETTDFFFFILWLWATEYNPLVFEKSKKCTAKAKMLKFQDFRVNLNEWRLNNYKKTNTIIFFCLGPYWQLLVKTLLLSPQTPDWVKTMQFIAGRALNVINCKFKVVDILMSLIQTYSYLEQTH